MQNAFTVNLLAAKHFFSKRRCQGAGRRENRMQRPTLPLFFEDPTQARRMTGRRAGLCSGSVPDLGPAMPQGEVSLITSQSQAELLHHSSKRAASELGAGFISALLLTLPCFLQPPGHR